MTDYLKDATERLAKCGGTIRIRLSDTKLAPWVDDDDNTPYRPHYRVTLTGPGGSYTLDYWGSINDGETGAEASAYDVLACLTWFDPGTFEQFCDEFGYEPDSSKANKVWRAVKAQAAALQRIFPSETARQSLAEIR
jgi:hypothetical protein